MRETSYHDVIAGMTVRSLWETQNVMDCIPDELWQRLYGGAPLWQHLYHALHSLDQWFINPRATDFVEPPIHTPHLHTHLGMLMGFIVAETGLCPRTLQVGEPFPQPPYDPYRAP